MAISIREEKYEAVYDITSGPNNFSLSVGFIFPPESGPNTVKFYSQQGKIKRRFNVLLVKMRNAVGPKFGDANVDVNRELWEFEGLVCNREPNVVANGTYNSRTRQGKIHLLAHEQPKPLVEVISWQEMFKRTVAAISEGARVVLEQKYRDYAMYRGRLIGIEDLGGRFRADCDRDKGVSVLMGDTWSPTTTSSFAIEIEKDVFGPLALADQRILFTVRRCDYTVYLSADDVTCP